MAIEMEIDYEQVLAALDQLDVVELAGVVDRASTLLKKGIAKGIPSKKKVVGGIPSQLEQNHEWVKYVLGDARLNGWESFEMRSTKTNKSTGEKVIEEVVMAGSTERDGVHVFADTGKEMSQGHAMCYSKLLKDRNDEVYQTFLANYSAVSGTVKKATSKVVKKTSAEVEAEKAAKEAEKEAEKELKEAKKKAEKELKEAEKAAEKAAEKKKKEDEKAAKEAAKAKPVARTTGILVPVKRERAALPAAAVEVVEEAGMPELEALPVVTTVVPKKVVKKVVPVKAARPVDPFVAGPSGEKRWEWKGVQYVRYEDNLVYLWDVENNDYGEFQGRYNYELDVIEECELPTTEDSVEEEDLGA